jgi:hypothetical protein
MVADGRLPAFKFGNQWRFKKRALKNNQCKPSSLRKKTRVPK